MVSAATLSYRAYTTSSTASIFKVDISANFLSTNGFNEYGQFTLSTTPSPFAIRYIEFWNESLQTQKFFLGKVTAVEH